MTEEERREVLARLPTETASRLLRSLGYAEDRAGGIMTTVLVTVREDETVDEVRKRLKEARDHEVDLDSVDVVDDQGRLVDVITVLELFLAERGEPIRNLVGPPWPVTVNADATVDEVADQLLDNRTTSVVVIDDEGRPLGRILADDIVDALTPERGRLRIFRLAPQ
jgi:Mg/Co/Ni transporter MgtE